jgi:hypothetical protein
MGKKGKKRKEKITGTPDVVKFKQTRDFFTLKEAVAVQEALPFVQSDLLDELAWKRVARFLNILGLLAKYCMVDSPKEYRFRYHHKYLAPAPQYFPEGYTRQIVEAARTVVDNPYITFNGKEYSFPEDLKHRADDFLKHLDLFLTNVAGVIEVALKEDFTNGGLKSFKASLSDKLKTHDKEWVKFEEAYMKEMQDIHKEVFTPVDNLVTLESQLSAAEERGAIAEKQRLENELVYALEEFVNLLYPDKSESTPFPEDVIPLAEAAVFYALKMGGEGLNLCKHLIKAYLELRVYITEIRRERLHPQYHENKAFCRLLKTFYQSVLDASDALEVVSRKPRLLDCKTEGWMTKALMEPEIKEMQDPRWQQEGNALH